MSDPNDIAADLNTPPEVLAQLAYQHPELHPVIAQHPNAYPELLAWIAEYGGPGPESITAGAVAGSQGVPASQPATFASQTPTSAAPAKKRRVAWIVGGIVMLVALVVGVVFLFLQRDSQEDQGALNSALLELEVAIERGEASLEESRAALNELTARLEPGAQEQVWELAEAANDSQVRLSEALSEGRGVAHAARETSDKTEDVIEDVQLATENLTVATAEVDELSTDIAEATVSLTDSQPGAQDQNADASSTECEAPVPGAYPCAGGAIPDEARPITSTDSQWATLRYEFPSDDRDRGCFVQTYEGEQRVGCSTETLFESIWPEKCVDGGEWCGSKVTLSLDESGPAEPGAPFSEAPPYFGEYGPPKGEMIVPGDVVYHDDFVFALSSEGMTVWNARSGYGAFAGFDGAFETFGP